MTITKANIDRFYTFADTEGVARPIDDATSNVMRLVEVIRSR